VIGEVPATKELNRYEEKLDADSFGKLRIGNAD